MANTYTQLRIHLVFAVAGRESMILKQHRQQVEKYITGILQKRNHKLLAIYCMPDHIHIFFGLHPEQSIAKLVEETKKASRSYIKSQSWMMFDFRWQRGYGAFSYAKSQTEAVVKYVLNQEQHHKKKTFKEEYLAILEKFAVDYDPQYLFEFYE